MEIVATKTKNISAKINQLSTMVTNEKRVGSIAEISTQAAKLNKEIEQVKTIFNKMKWE